jgi:outer membrane lipoprotein-sorting protein
MRVNAVCRPLDVALAASVLVLGMAGGMRADNREARRILEESVDRTRAVSMEYAGQVTTVSSSGRERRKVWRSYSQGSGGAANRLIRFVSPPDVRGIGFLSRTRPSGLPDQWLYLPSMKRERRVSSRDRDTPFVGTDFTFEDLDELDPARLDTEQLSDRTIEGLPCYVIEIRPRDPASYERKLLTLAKDSLSLMSVEIFVAGHGAPARILRLSDYRNIQGRLVPLRLEMTDLRKGSRTTILVSDVVLDRPQPADRFTIQNLLREWGD